MNSGGELIFSVSDFVTVCNQTLEFAYPSAVIEGELANFRISKNRWVFFDLKDETASLKFFGMVHQLPGPLEDGMTVRVQGVPRLHPQFGFSIVMQNIRPVGVGVIKRAAELLHDKLALEGLFDESRKRSLPYPPERIGLIASRESAAFADFTKILGARWGGLEIIMRDVQVQGEAAPEQIVAAITQFNAMSVLPEVLVITRGGGSAEDLQAFSDERVVRAVAASRIPVLAAIGHETDISLAELAADKRASTPSNAAEFLTPDRQAVIAGLASMQRDMGDMVHDAIMAAQLKLSGQQAVLAQNVESAFREARWRLTNTTTLLEALNPKAVLRRGYAIVRSKTVIVSDAKQLHGGDIVNIEFRDGHRQATVTEDK